MHKVSNNKGGLTSKVDQLFSHLSDKQPDLTFKFMKTWVEGQFEKHVNAPLALCSPDFQIINGSVNDIYLKTIVKMYDFYCCNVFVVAK